MLYENARTNAGRLRKGPESYELHSGRGTHPLHTSRKANKLDAYGKSGMSVTTSHPSFCCA